MCYHAPFYLQQLKFDINADNFWVWECGFSFHFNIANLFSRFCLFQNVAEVRKAKKYFPNIAKIGGVFLNSLGLLSRTTFWRTWYWWFSFKLKFFSVWNSFFQHNSIRFYSGVEYIYWPHFSCRNPAQVISCISKLSLTILSWNT